MIVLLDTCVLSELRHPQGDPVVKANVRALSRELVYLSVISIGEIAKGIALLTEGKSREELARWLFGLEDQYSDRILAVDLEISRLWGEIADKAQLQGVQVSAPDGLIAATALRHGLHVVTRNTKHFIATGAQIIDPWES